MAASATSSHPVSLKRGPARRKLMGLHIDRLLEVATKAGYAVTVWYGNAALRSEGRRVLAVRLNDRNRVVAVR